MKTERSFNMNTRKRAVIRLIVAALAMLNAILTAAGINPIPFDEALVTEWLSYAFDAAMLVWVWWKDAPLTRAGITGHDVMRAIKEDGIEILDKLLDGEGVDNGEDI